MQKTKLNKQILANLGNIKIHHDKDFIKVGFKDNGGKNWEFLISDINAKDNSFQINGQKLKIDRKKTYSENVVAISNKIHRDNSTVKLKWKFPFVLIDNSYAFWGLVLKGLALVVGAIIIPEVLITWDYVKHKEYFEELYALCTARNKDIVYGDSKTKVLYDELVMYKSYREIIIDMQKYNCIEYADRIGPNSRYYKTQLDAICLAADNALKCIDDYKKESETKQQHLAPSNSQPSNSALPEAAKY